MTDMKIYSETIDHTIVIEAPDTESVVIHGSDSVITITPKQAYGLQRALYRAVQALDEERHRQIEAASVVFGKL